MGFPGARPVDGIVPVAGWSLGILDDWDSEGFYSPFWVVSGPGGDRYLHVRRNWKPSQDQFAWLVAHDFPALPIGNWSNADIAALMALQRAA